MPVIEQWTNPDVLRWALGWKKHQIVYRLYGLTPAEIKIVEEGERKARRLEDERNVCLAAILIDWRRYEYYIVEAGADWPDSESRRSVW